MDSLLTACQDVSGKQNTMQTTITHKISALKSILQEAKSAMENGIHGLFLFVYTFYFPYAYYCI
jgi:hypothetical protein